MAGAAVNLVDSKDLKAIVKELDSLPPPHSEHDLKGGLWKPRRVRLWKSPLVMLHFSLLAWA
jgi:hypothetical protein